MTETVPKRVFSVTGALILLVVCAILTVVMLVDAGMRSGFEGALRLAPWLLLVLWAVYVIGVASDIRADMAGVRVQNFLRRTSVPWSAVTRIAMRWQLEFILDGGRVLRCFGGPARSRARRLGPERTRENGVAETEDGIAMLQRLRSDAAPDAARQVTRSWDVPALVALVVLLAWIGATLITL